MTILKIFKRSSNIMLAKLVLLKNKTQLREPQQKELISSAVQSSKNLVAPTCMRGFCVVKLPVSGNEICEEPYPPLLQFFRTYLSPQRMYSFRNAGELISLN